MNPQSKKRTPKAARKASKDAQDTQEKNTITRSISFDPEVFKKMEEVRTQRGLERSQFVRQLIAGFLLGRGELFNGPLPEDLVPKRLKKPGKGGTAIDV